MAYLESNYQVVQPQGSKDNYGGSVVTYNFSVSNPTVWVPSKSFFRCQITLLANADRPTVARCLALAEGAVGNSIQNASFEAGGVTVSRISTAASQIGALKTRRGSSRAWLNSVGASATGWGGTFSERLAAVAGDTKQLGLLGSADTYVENINRAGCGPAATATISIVAGATNVTGNHGEVVLVGGTVTDAIIGAKFVCGNYIGTVSSRSDGVTFKVTPAPVAEVDPTTNWYFVQRDTATSPQGKHIIEVMWQPPLGIMDPETPALGGGSFKFELTPFADYRARMVEALSHVAYGTAGATGWTLEMDAPDLYLYTAKHSYGSSSIEFPLREYQSYSQVIGGDNKVLQLTVPRSTTKVHIFLQASTAGTNTTTPISKFTDAARSDLNLTSLQVTYAGQTKFKTPWPSSFVAGSTNQLTAMYYASLVENDKEADQTECVTSKGATPVVATTSGGAETIMEWFQRGPIWTLAFNRSAAGSEVDMTVDINYSSATATSVLFVVAEYERLATIRSEANQIVKVEVISN
jgi:hypothetical protein